jgi:ribose transport system permease protein
MSDLRHRLYHNGGLLAAIGLFGLMFTIYVANHPVGLTAAVAATAANKAVLLALVAMAQTLPVLTRGLDLSVGMVFILANCMASAIVVGTIGEGLLGIAAVLGAGALAGFLNGAIVVWGRLQPIITTLAPSTMASRSTSGRAPAATCNPISPILPPVSYSASYPQR